MKTIALRLLLLLALLWLFDVGYGALCRTLRSHSRGGYTGRMTYITEQTSEDVLIFGASRGIHHYDPQIIEDTLGLTAYNCAIMGQGIIYHYGLWTIISERYAPKMIIVDVAPPNDLYKGDNSPFVAGLLPYYDRPAVGNICRRVEPGEARWMWMNLYRWNSKLPRLVSDFVSPLQEMRKGFYPLPNDLDVNIIGEGHDPAGNVDSLKLYYMERLCDECAERGTELIFAASPLWRNTDDSDLAPLRELCQRKHVRLIDHYTDTLFVGRRELFRDRMHLNARGAEEYTKLIVGELKK